MKYETFFPFLIWFKLLTKESIKADLIAGLAGAEALISENSSLKPQALP